MTSTYAIAAISGLALIATSPAWAEVTAEQVWSNMIAPVEAMGGQVTVATTRSGNQLGIGDTQMRFTLPMDAGTLIIAADGMNLVENGDGSVDLVYPSAYKASFSLEDAEGLVGSVALTMNMGQYITTATGTPGDITYAYDWNDGTFQFNDLNVPDYPEMSLNMTGTGTGMQGTYQITEGPLMRFVAAGTGGDLTFAATFMDNMGILSESTQTITGGTSRMALTIPTGQVSLLNLSQALRDGLSVSLDARDTHVASYDTSTVDGAPLMTQNYGYRADTTSYKLDASGLVADGTQSDFWLEFDFPDMLPVPIKVTAAGLQGAMTMPLNQTQGAADAAMATTITGLEADESLWSLFDPQQQLPRDPANLTIDLSGKLAVLSDLLDIEGWMNRDTMDPAPLELTALSIDALDLDVIGTRLTASGDFTLDNSDLVTFDGIPALDGTLNMTLTGANTLLDQLVSMGLLPEDQAMAARMAMGVITVPGEGEDSLTSQITIQSDGQVSANGQRLK